jgi:phosphatidate cytidylyltransferase
LYIIGAEEITSVALCSSTQAPMRLSGSLRTAVPVLGPLLALALEAEWLHPLIGLWLYAGTFVATILSLRKHLLKQQLRTLSFTALALSLFVVPMKMAIHNAYVGLFWFLLPLMLVATNDTFAYFSGFCLGRKLIRRPFLALSPNKTWEGFLGGGAATLAAGFYLPLLLNHPYLTCSFEAAELAAWEGLAPCTPAALFLPAPSGGPLAVQWHGLALAAFASTVAPFGGFAASAIKRAYGIKDFANFIPGHGNQTRRSRDAQAI